MRIVLTERFQSDVRNLAAAERTAVFETLLALPQGIGKPHAHTGIGLRKIHRSGIWEARVGLGLRIVFGVEESTAKLLVVGTHNEVARFLKSL